MTMVVTMKHILQIRQQLRTADNLVVNSAQAANFLPMPVLGLMRAIVGARQVKQRGIQTQTTVLLLEISALSWVSG